MQKIVRAGIVALVFAVASVGAARADAILTFTPDTLTITPGGTVEFDGTLTNTGADDLYLNNDTFFLPYADLTVDDSAFIFGAPLFLSSGDSYIGAFIDVTADDAILPGSYGGTYTIQGGADSNTFDNIATVDFTVDFDSSQTTPEPNTLLLLASGLMLLAVVRLRRRAAVSK